MSESYGSFGLFGRSLGRLSWMARAASMRARAMRALIVRARDGRVRLRLVMDWRRWRKDRVSEALEGIPRGLSPRLCGDHAGRH